MKVEFKVKDILKMVKDNEKYPKRWNKGIKDNLLFNDPGLTDFVYINFYKLRVGI